MLEQDGDSKLRGIGRGITMTQNRLVLSCFLVFICFFRLGAAYFVHIDADDEECFFDKAENGMKMSEL